MAEGWGEQEVDRAVDTYFRMLELELQGTSFKKVDFYRPLSQEIGRTEGSVERKWSNISAVLLELESTFIEGYKPLSNVQALLRNKVRARFEDEPEIRRLMIRLAEQEIEPGETTLGEPIAVPDLLIPTSTNRGPRIGRKVDFGAREAHNRQRGRAGELLVVERERRVLAAQGRDDLAKRVRHVAEVDGDGLGFDILSFNPDGEERFLEVKTTIRSEHQPFFVSSNEVEFSAEEPERFALVRVFHLDRTPGFYELRGSLHETAVLRPDSYAALPRAASS